MDRPLIALFTACVGLRIVLWIWALEAKDSQVCCDCSQLKLVKTGGESHAQLDSLIQLSNPTILSSVANRRANRTSEFT